MRIKNIQNSGKNKNSEVNLKKINLLIFTK